MYLLLNFKKISLKIYFFFFDFFIDNNNTKDHFTFCTKVISNKLQFAFLIKRRYE